jgi:MFS family permease
MMAAGASIFTAACLVLAGAGSAGSLAYPALLVAAIAVGIGECFHTAALMPLVADLAPPAVRGRYMAATALSWWTGLALAPTLGTQALAVSPAGALVAAAAIAAAAALSLLSLEGRLPEGVRTTPTASTTAAARV